MYNLSPQLQPLVHALTFCAVCWGVTGLAWAWSKWNEGHYWGEPDCDCDDCKSERERDDDGEGWKRGGK
jgi:hypothetical protein